MDRRSPFDRGKVPPASGLRPPSDRGVVPPASHLPPPSDRGVIPPASDPRAPSGPGIPPRAVDRRPQAPQATGPNLPDQRREHRRAAIARACLDRLAAEGLADARLEQLAADAALSRQNLLFYFRDKSDLWAEAAACALDELYRALTRLVAGEVGPAAIRATRRGIDEVSRVLPAAFAVALDSAATAVRASPAQQQRAAESQALFLSTLSASLAAPGRPTDASLRLARLASITLLAHHREARTHERSGLAPALPLAADLDHAELQLVAIARTLGPRPR